jgi:hypothetical protein
MAPRILLYRTALRFTVEQAASLLDLDVDQYERKEWGTDQFSSDELIQLWNWFTLAIPSLPEDLQNELKTTFG